jgi:hypothetical protein
MKTLKNLFNKKKQIILIKNMSNFILMIEKKKFNLIKNQILILKL